MLRQADKEAEKERTISRCGLATAARSVQSWPMTIHTSSQKLSSRRARAGGCPGWRNARSDARLLKSGSSLGVQKIVSTTTNGRRRCYRGCGPRAPCAGLATRVPLNCGSSRIRHRSERRCRVEALRLSAAVVVCFSAGNLIYVAGNSPADTTCSRTTTPAGRANTRHGKPVCRMR